MVTLSIALSWSSRGTGAFGLPLGKIDSARASHARESASSPRAVRPAFSWVFALASSSGANAGMRSCSASRPITVSVSCFRLFAYRSILVAPASISTCAPICDNASEMANLSCFVVPRCNSIAVSAGTAGLADLLATMASPSGMEPAMVTTSLTSIG